MRHTCAVWSRRSWLLAAIAVASAGVYWMRPAELPRGLPPGWIATVGVLADGDWVEPWGLAASPDGTIYVADGAGANRIRAISPAGQVSTIAGGDEGFADGAGVAARFRTPSGLALDRAGTLFVADTGNNAIRRITSAGEVTTLTRALNGPMGVAIHPDGRLLVADTYNDRIVAIDAAGALMPIADDIAFDTPTALTVDAGGTIYVADTGNNVIRAIAPDGQSAVMDPVSVGGLRHPLGVAVDATGRVYMTDESRLIEMQPGSVDASVRVLAGSAPGFRHGRGVDAQFRRPASVVSLAPGRLIVADAGNGFVRTVTAIALAEAAPPPSPQRERRFGVDAFDWRPLLWPLEPLSGPFEIAGTLGEARGQDANRFHAGIDVRADHGTLVLTVRDGLVTAPLATGDFGSLNEWLRLGELSYVHMRVGRTLHGEVLDDTRFVATRDERGRINGMRVKRGARFSTGDVIGSVNAFNHVHLNVGWNGEDYNPLLFRLVQFEDTVPPTIARGGVRLYDAHGTALRTRAKGRLVVSGPVQIVVDAWDQANGNRPNRRLGVYSLGYHVLNADGTPAPGYPMPIETIRFDRLGRDPDATELVYAPGSGIPFYGQRRTRFLYTITNTFRDGIATPGVWDTSQLMPGDYILRVKVADFSGNEARAHRDVAITITGPKPGVGG